MALNAKYQVQKTVILGLTGLSPVLHQAIIAVADTY